MMPFHICQIFGSALYLKAGTALDHETDPDLEVIVRVDDSTVGGSPDATTAQTFTITDANDAPTAVDDSNSMTEDTDKVAGDVEANDTDPDGDGLNVSEVEGVAGNVGNAVAGTYGTITINADGSYTYDLNEGLAAVQGLDDGEQLTETFDYTISDGALTDTATLTITITGSNDAPVITSNGGGDTGAVSVDENQTAVTTVVATDIDMEGITYTISGGADQGLFSITAGGVLTFDAAPDFETPTDANTDNVYEVVVTASDGDASDTQTLHVTVNDVAEGPPPNSAPTDLTFESVSDTPTGASGSVIADVFGVDPDVGDTLSYAITADASGKFSINSSTGEIALKGGSSSFAANAGANPTASSGVTGHYTAPVLVDINNDGDMDIYYGSDDGGHMKFMEGAYDMLGWAAYFGPVEDPFGLSPVAASSRRGPAFADLDNDGDFDLFVGEADGTINYYQNTGNNTAPAFAAAVSNPFGFTDIGTYAKPTFVDIDNDGDLDAFVGGATNVYYFENTGTVAAPAFAARVINPFGLPAISSAAPAFHDNDGDGDMDAYIGNAGGDVVYFENTGTAAAPTFAAGVATNYGSLFATPTFGDIDLDGDEDMYVGGAWQHLAYVENTSTAGSSINFSSVQSYDLTIEVTDTGALTYSETMTIRTGTSGANTITGTGNDDLIFGMDGADTLDGDDGDDRLYGGDGSDIFRVEANHGDDFVYGGAGGGWVDEIILAGVVGGSGDGDWTLSLQGGHSSSPGAGDQLVLSADAAGLITFTDGGQIYFEQIEYISW